MNVFAVGPSVAYYPFFAAAEIDDPGTIMMFEPVVYKVAVPCRSCFIGFFVGKEFALAPVLVERIVFSADYLVCPVAVKVRHAHRMGAPEPVYHVHGPRFPVMRTGILVDMGRKMFRLTIQSVERNDRIKDGRFCTVCLKTAVIVCIVYQ